MSFHNISQHFTTVGIWRNMTSPVAFSFTDLEPETQLPNGIQTMLGSGFSKFDYLQIFRPFYHQNWKKLENSQKT